MTATLPATPTTRADILAYLGTEEIPLRYLDTGEIVLRVSEDGTNARVEVWDDNSPAAPVAVVPVMIGLVTP